MEPTNLLIIVSDEHRRFYMTWIRKRFIRP
jgi:hypothetical protein